MLFLSLLFNLGVTVTPVPADSTDSYKLVWADEFDYSGKPDPNKWDYERGFVRNKELQWYQPENATVKDGLLIIEGRREEVVNPNYDPAAKESEWQKSRKSAQYTSSSLMTYGKQSWTYGKFQVRAKLPFDKGSWPAIWFLGNVRNEGTGWPKCGEIDLLELYIYGGKQSILANVMDGNGKWNTQTKPVTDFEKDNAAWKDEFHLWEMEWTPEKIVLSLDGQVLNTTIIRDMTNRGTDFNPFQNPQYLILNLALGSSGGDPSQTTFPLKYEIDYVRVYQKVE